MTVEDQLLALTSKVDALTTAVAAIPTAPVTPPPPTVDFTPILTAIAGVQTTADSILAQDEPTPVTPPAPAPAPATPSAA